MFPIKPVWLIQLILNSLSCLCCLNGVILSWIYGCLPCQHRHVESKRSTVLLHVWNHSWEWTRSWKTRLTHAISAYIIPIGTVQGRLTPLSPFWSNKLRFNPFLISISDFGFLFSIYWSTLSQYITRLYYYCIYLFNKGSIIFLKNWMLNMGIGIRWLK